MQRRKDNLLPLASCILYPVSCILEPDETKAAGQSRVETQSRHLSVSR